MKTTARNANAPAGQGQGDAETIEDLPGRPIAPIVAPPPDRRRCTACGEPMNEPVVAATLAPHTPLSRLHPGCAFGIAVRVFSDIGTARERATIDAGGSAVRR